MTAAEPEYDDRLIGFLERLWGDGWLSPGGAAEVDRLLAGLPLAGLRVLDLGCGSGGIACHLAATHGAAAVTGFDVEAPVIAAARARAGRRGLAGRVRFVEGAPGPLPFPDGAFDVVFSKDALVHVPGKEAVFAECFRVLAPGGALAVSDWCCRDETLSPDMAAYVAAEGLSFGMAPPGRYLSAVAAAGFRDAAATDRNTWYREVARQELARLRGPFGTGLAAEFGAEFIMKQIATWERMQKVLDTGEHRPTHFRATKP